MDGAKDDAKNTSVMELVPSSSGKENKGKPPKILDKPFHTIRLTEAKIYDIIDERNKAKSKYTRAFGKINFTTGNDKTSSELIQYVRLDHRSNADDVLQLLKSDWELSKPGLLISVTGAARNIKELTPKDQASYFGAIVDAAVSTNAWIVTGGTDAGVMKYTGDAVKKHRDTTGDDVTTIGIATWGVIKESHRNELTLTDDEVKVVKQKRKRERQNDFLWSSILGQKEKESLGSYLPPKELPPPTGEPDNEEGVTLNPHYTHFILVDAHEGFNFGGEIALRGKIEGAISKKWKEVNAGNGTENNEGVNMDEQNGNTNASDTTELAEDDTHIPVVCIVLSGGPGTITTVYEAVKNKTPVIIVNGTGRAANLMAEIFLDKATVTARDITRYEGKLMNEFGDNELLCKTLTKQLIACLGNSHLISVWNRSSDMEMGKEMYGVILRALKQAQTEAHEQFMLALTWDRFEMVGEIEKEMADKKWDDAKLKKALTYALIHNRTDFIGFILGKMNVKEYLTNEKLEELYYKASNDVLKNLIEETTRKTIHKPGRTKTKEQSYDLSDIDKVIKRLTEDTIDIDQHKRKNDNEQGCWQKLFLYSVLNGFDEMAEEFWDRGLEAIPAALTASKLYKCMASLKQNEGEQWKERMQQNASKYEDWAYNILTRCHKDRRSGARVKPYDLLTRVLPSWGNVTCLNLADSAKNLKFYSHPVVRDLLDENWELDIIGCSMMPSRWKPWNYILDPIKLMMCSVFPFLIPFWITFRGSPTSPHWLSKIWMYYKAPRTIFRHNVVSHVVFILLFSYNLLWGDFILAPRRGSSLDRLLLAWVFSMLFEEFRQMLEWEANTFRLGLAGWWSDNWNKVDILAQFLFVLGTLLRYHSDPIVTENARILLAFDLFIFYIRLLEYLTIVKRIGPKVFMIGRMFIDLGFFVCIIFIVLIGYGVTVHIILYPQVDHPKTVFESILFRPYFQIYGELFLEEITATPGDGSCSNYSYFDEATAALGEVPCARHPRIGTVLLAIYLAFSNVLLLNLLIAMFSNTFNQVQEQNDIHWKFQRYALIKEFIHKPIFPPPLILISLVWHVLVHLLFLLLLALSYCIDDPEERLKWADLSSVFQYMRKYYDEDRENEKKKVNRLVLWEERKATQFKQTREKHSETGQLMIPQDVHRLSIIKVTHKGD